MNILLLILAFCFAEINAEVQAITFKKECVEENGYNATHVNTLKTEQELLEYIPNMDKWACIYACMVRNSLKKSDTIYGVISYSLNFVSQPPNAIDADTIKQMQEILNNCKGLYGEDGCDFLKCLKIAEEPFASFLTIPSTFLNAPE